MKGYFTVNTQKEQEAPSLEVPGIVETLGSASRKGVSGNEDTEPCPRFQKELESAMTTSMQAFDDKDRSPRTLTDHWNKLHHKAASQQMRAGHLTVITVLPTQYTQSSATAAQWCCFCIAATLLKY
ncbi:hypothetical protein O3P69_015992 [Scylla paramamosain]|uniref:Uncharacterized protein n=1 Tax=Scylla paramamosain TaxID=85552 RepID=A0AAW0T8G5_SCYPA